MNKRYVATWKDNGWSFYDLGWIVWAIGIGIVVTFAIFSALSLHEDDVAQSIAFVLVLTFLFITPLVIWILGMMWWMFIGKYHYLLSKTFDVRPSVMVEELDWALAEYGVDVKEVMHARSRRVNLFNHAIFVLGDGRTKLSVLKSFKQRGSTLRLRTVVHLGPLGRSNLNLMESARKAVESINFPDDEEGLSRVSRELESVQERFKRVWAVRILIYISLLIVAISSATGLLSDSPLGIMVPIIFLVILALGAYQGRMVDRELSREDIS